MIKKYGIYIVVIFLLLIASVMIYTKLNPKELPANLISATGKMDGDIITLNTKYPGRVKQILVNDGQAVNKNQTVAILKSREFKTSLYAAQSEIDAAKQANRAMHDELALLKVSIPLEAKKAKKAITIAHHKQLQLSDAIASLQAVLAQDKRDLQRVKKLYSKNLIAKQKLEYTQLKVRTDTNKLKALKAELAEAKQAVDIAQESYKQALAQQKKIDALQAKIAASNNKIAALQAQKQKVGIIIDELSIASPINGFVIEKIANIGEVLAPGSVIATLIDPHSLYLKVFVDTIQNGKVKIGDDAVIFLDAYPNKPIKAKVVNIAANAEFTPKDVAVRSDRIQRVFAVHLKPLQVDPLLKLGLPAIGVITIDGKGLPASLNEIPSI